MSTVQDLADALKAARPDEDLLDFVSTFMERRRDAFMVYPEEGIIYMASPAEDGPMSDPMPVAGEMIELMVRKLQAEIE